MSEQNQGYRQLKIAHRLTLRTEAVSEQISIIQLLMPVKAVFYFCGFDAELTVPHWTSERKDALEVNTDTANYLCVVWQEKIFNQVGFSAVS